MNGEFVRSETKTTDEVTPSGARRLAQSVCMKSKGKPHEMAIGRTIKSANLRRPRSACRSTAPLQVIENARLLSSFTGSRLHYSKLLVYSNVPRVPNLKGLKGLDYNGRR